jgi:hypothetical protein
VFLQFRHCTLFSKSCPCSTAHTIRLMYLT